MIKVTGLLTLASLLLLAAPVAAQDETTRAEIRIRLPEDADPQVSIVPGVSRIAVELPRGASFPLDFAASTGGLVRDGEVTPLDDSRVRLELDLSSGLLDRIEYGPREVVLHFVSLFADGGDTTTPDDHYLLGPDDKIGVSVHGHEDLSTRLTISDSGTISAPLIGEVEAAGSTPHQLAVRLAEILGRNYLVDPRVDVEVIEFRSQWAMVSGQVRVPGRVALRGGTRLKEAISEAGGFTEYAGEEMVISRAATGGDDKVTLRVARERFETGDANPMLFDGDFVEVGEAAYAYVNGEVRAPGRVRIERDMTLLRAISIQGGLTQWADQKEVRILRPEGSETVVNLKRIQNGKDEDPRLVGGEIIVIKRRFF